MNEIEIAKLNTAAAQHHQGQWVDIWNWFETLIKYGRILKIMVQTQETCLIEFLSAAPGSRLSNAFLNCRLLGPLMAEL